MFGPYYGSKKGPYDVQVGVGWDGFEFNGDKSQARLVGCEIWRDSSANIVDSTNDLSWSGGAVSDGSDSVSTSGTGRKKLKSVTGQWQTLSYSSQVTSSFSVSWSGVNAADGTVSVSRTVKYPLRPIGAPDTPGTPAVSGSGASRTLTWTNTNPADSSKPYQQIEVRRRVNGSATTPTVAVLGVVTSWTTSDLPTNSKIEWSVRAKNSAGTSGWSAWATAMYTTLATPTMGSAAKNSVGNIVVTLTNLAPWATAVEIEDSADGVSWSNVGSPSVSAIGTVTWTHTGPNAGITHRYRARAVRSGMQSGYSATSNVVQLQAAPNPPTILAPAAGAVFDPTEPLTVQWLHNPVDTTPQTQREVQYRLNAGSWTSLGGVVTTTAQTLTAAANTWTSGTLELQVRTRGAHATFSPWSATRTVTLTRRPVATLVAPSGTVNTATIAVEVSFYDPDGQGWARTRATLASASGDLIETIEADGGLTILPPFANRLANTASFQVGVQVMNDAGLWSAFDTNTITVAFLPPGVPQVVSTEWDHDRAAVSVQTDNPAGQAAVELRRNHAADPAGVSALAQGVGRWTAGSSSEATYSNATGITGPFSPTTAKRLTLTGTGVQGHGWHVVGVTNAASPTGVPLLSVTPGSPVTLSMWVRWTTASVVAIVGYWQVRYSADGATWQAAETTLPNAALAAGQWVRVSATFTPPAGAIWLASRFVSSGPSDRAVGNTMEATGLLIEKVGTLGDYFDGDLPDSSTEDYAWTGTANLSASTATSYGTTDTAFQRLWRVNDDGTETLIADLIPADGTVTDPTPLTTGQTYRLEAVTTEGATASNTFSIPADPVVAGSWWINVGADLVTFIRYNPRRERSATLAQVGEYYAGRPDETVVYGEARTRGHDLAGVITPDEGTDWATLEAMALTPDVAVVRGPDGSRIRVRIAGTTASDSSYSKQDVSLQLVRVGDDSPFETIDLGA